MFARPGLKWDAIGKITLLTKHEGAAAIVGNRPLVFIGMCRL